MLVLFDIDLTLLTTNGAGMRAMVRAGEALFGGGFHAEGIAFAGRLDPLIIADLFRANGVEPAPDDAARFRAAYAAELARAMALPGAARALPGVHDLLGALRARRPGDARLALGVLTGNFEETGTMKLHAAGIDVGQFDVRAWGDQSVSRPPVRSDLVVCGMRSYAAVRGASCDASRVVVVGDTEHDVAAARAHGCRALGVATGRTPAPALAEAGADVVFEDLSDTSRVLRAFDALVG
ncbi:MAG: HAD hydrolase-like protein [Planctomycetota bacterium]|nr:HAD hydrolase-like protein [Planctomycetota bacterium]